jgi:hypothetical protein
MTSHLYLSNSGFSARDCVVLRFVCRLPHKRRSVLRQKLNPRPHNDIYSLHNSDEERTSKLPDDMVRE